MTRSRLALIALASALLTAVAAAPAADAASCSRVASPLGSDGGVGSEAQPFKTAQRLADSLAPGEVGCLRAGSYSGGLSITKGGSSDSQRVTLRPYPSENVTLAGRVVVKKGADFVTVEGLNLDGRNTNTLPSPTINANDVTFARNDITNSHTAICFVVGASNVDNSATYGRAARTVIELNKIHNCGKLPATNHHHGIYVEGADDTRIAGNWIYDNADRGIQLYPDAQRTTIVNNVLDGNGSGIIFSGDQGVSANDTTAQNNIITNSKLRYNAESWYPDGTPQGRNNTLRQNCVHGAARTDYGTAGIATGDGGFTATNNTTANPQYLNPTGKDFRIGSSSPCAGVYSPSNPVPGPGGAAAPAPAPTPEPDPTPTPEPTPTPAPAPTPEPDPTPAPAPTPQPQPAPEPAPTPTPQPQPPVSKPKPVSKPSKSRNRRDGRRGSKSSRKSKQQRYAKRSRR